MTPAAPAPTSQKAPPLPEGFMDFIGPLRQAFEGRRAEILRERAAALRAALEGRAPGYRPESEATSGSWRLGLPDWARDQRNQITGPADNAKYLVSMCNAKDPGCMPDGEDSIVSEWSHARLSHAHTAAAIRGTLSYSDEAKGKTVGIKPSAQLMFYRPRGLALDEAVFLPGDKASAAILDLGAVFFETADLRRKAVQESGLQRKLGFYIPKTESAEEAAWWSDLLAAMEAAIGIPIGTTKVMFLVESLPAAYQVEEIIFAARRHIIGLNLGRWDYMASLLHFKLADPGWILPDRNTIPHDIPFFQNLRLRLVDCCHRRGILAIGGMTALFPDRADPDLNERALARLRVDKKNEAAAGFDGAWTGHPDQHEGAISQFPAPNQLHVTHPQAPRKPDLTPNPKGVGRVTVAGTRDAIRTVIEYRFGVLSGLGARLIKGYDAASKPLGAFMEDLATDRIYRLMIAQRIRHAVVAEDGTRLTPSAVSAWFDLELEKILKDQRGGDDSAAVAERYRKAREWSETMIKEVAKPVPEGIKTWTYPTEEIAKMYAPHEEIHPAAKLRSILKERFERRKVAPEKSFLCTAGAYDALTSSLLTDLGYEAIYASGWQLAVAHSMYPDIGIYPSHAMVGLVYELIRGIEGTRDRHFYDTGGEVLNAPPIFADIEAGFGGPTQTFTLVRELIRAGAAGVHLEDQDPAERTCGHIVAHHGTKRDKVLVPTNKWIEKLIAVKAAVQATGVPLVIIARTDAVDGAVPGGRGGGVPHAIDRALEAASLGVDVIWAEYNTTDIENPHAFAEGVHKYYPDQMLGFNLSPSLHWGKAKKEGHLITNAQLGQAGYVLQFSTLLAFRTVGMSLENTLRRFRTHGLEGLADLQLSEVESPHGEPRTRMHQKFAGTNRWLTLEKISKGA